MDVLTNAENRIGAEGARAVADALKHVPTLQSLNLQGMY
jgi:hypothetical protein